MGLMKKLKGEGELLEQFWSKGDEKRDKDKVKKEINDKNNNTLNKTVMIDETTLNLLTNCVVNTNKKIQYMESRQNEIYDRINYYTTHLKKMDEILSINAQEFRKMFNSLTEDVKIKRKGAKKEFLQYVSNQDQYYITMQQLMISAMGDLQEIQLDSKESKKKIEKLIANRSDLSELELELQKYSKLLEREIYFQVTKVYERYWKPVCIALNQHAIKAEEYLFTVVEVDEKYKEKREKDKEKLKLDRI